MTVLSVNLNKFALVRNSRGTNTPDILSVGKRCIEAGAHGLTIHPRPDQRHATYEDAFTLGAYLKGVDGVEFNIEGNPIPKFLDVVCEVQPDQCTLVPDAQDQLTSDHGWDLSGDNGTLKECIARLKHAGIRVSLFMDFDNLSGMDAARALGADRVELYTEPYAQAFAAGTQGEVTPKFADASRHASLNNLGVNAGHDLSLKNLGYFLENVPGVLEVSIGHALVIESWDHGLEETIKKYIGILG